MLSGIAAHRTVGRRIEVSAIAAVRELAAEDPAPVTPAQYIDALERFLIARLGAGNIPAPRKAAGAVAGAVQVD